VTIKIPEIPRIQGTIYMGNTFYLPLALYDDEENTIPTDLTGMTPRATLMQTTGAHVADFACAVLAADEDYPERVVITMQSEATTALTKAKEYLGNLDLVDALGDPHRKVILDLVTELGQAPEAA
jgi:hypothetical protein